MDFQNYFYTLAQIFHNFGAVAVVSCALLSQLAPFQNSTDLQTKLARLSMFGWTVQGLSGLSFGTISYLYLGQFPDLHGIAIVSLYVKMACTALGISLSIYYLHSKDHIPPKRRNLIWKIMIILALTALIAAAFLRWFS